MTTKPWGWRGSWAPAPAGVPGAFSHLQSHCLYATASAGPARGTTGARSRHWLRRRGAGSWCRSQRCPAWAVMNERLLARLLERLYALELRRTGGAAARMEARFAFGTLAAASRRASGRAQARIHPGAAPAGGFPGTAGDGSGAGRGGTPPDRLRCREAFAAGAHRETALFIQLGEDEVVPAPSSIQTRLSAVCRMSCQSDF